MKDVIEVAKRLGRLGYVAGREGNISIRKGRFIYIKVSGVYLDEVTEKDFVKVDIEGKVVGKRRPSIELPMHLSAYRARDDIVAVIHSHPPYTVALSLLDEEFEPVTEEAKLYLKEGVGYVGSYIPGSEELAEAVGKKLKAGYNAVVLRGHGLLSVGSDIREAFERTVAVERCSMASFLLGIARGRWQA